MQDATRESRYESRKVKKENDNDKEGAPAIEKIV